MRLISLRSKAAHFNDDRWPQSGTCKHATAGAAVQPSRLLKNASVVYTQAPFNGFTFIQCAQLLCAAVSLSPRRGCCQETCHHSSAYCTAPHNGPGRRLLRATSNMHILARSEHLSDVFMRLNERFGLRKCRVAEKQSGNAAIASKLIVAYVCITLTVMILMTGQLEHSSSCNSASQAALIITWV